MHMQIAFDWIKNVIYRKELTVFSSKALNGVDEALVKIMRPSQPRQFGPNIRSHASFRRWRGPVFRLPPPLGPGGEELIFILVSRPHVIISNRERRIHEWVGVSEFAAIKHKWVGWGGEGGIGLCDNKRE